MNFLTPPESVIHDNANMDAEQLLVADDFVDEFIDLHVVDTLGAGRAVLNSAPLFLVPKEGQDGEW